MAQCFELTSSEILDCMKSLEKDVCNKTHVSLKEAGSLLGKKGSVVSQYAKAGLIHPVQQGSKKIISMDEMYLLQVYMHAVKNYGCSYVACKILGGLLRDSGKDPYEYMDYIKSIEENLLEAGEVAKNVNSYENRGIYQKKKEKESRGRFQFGPRSNKTDRS